MERSDTHILLNSDEIENISSEDVFESRLNLARKNKHEDYS